MTERDDALNLFGQRIKDLMANPLPEDQNMQKIESFINEAKSCGVSSESLLSKLLNLTPVEILVKVNECVKEEQGLTDDDIAGMMAPED